MISASAAILTTGSVTNSSLPGSRPVGRRKQKYTRLTKIAVTGLNSANAARNRPNIPNAPNERSFPRQLSLSPPPPPPKNFLIPPPNPPPPESSNCARVSSLARDPIASISARFASSSFLPWAMTRTPRAGPFCLPRIPPPGTVPERDTTERTALVRRLAATVGFTTMRFPTHNMLTTCVGTKQWSVSTKLDRTSCSHA